MQDTASPVVPAAPAAQAVVVQTPAADTPALAFADAEGASRWVKSLVLTGVNPMYEAIFGQLRAVSAANFSPRERATIAEVLREQVSHLHTELARRYAGKAQPASDRENEATEQAVVLWHALWEQYSACLKPLLEGDTELQGVKAKLLQRGLGVGKQLLVVYGLARRTPPAMLWPEMHAYYRLAEMLDCATTAVSDDLQPNAIGMSCYSTYCHALLFWLADPCAMTVRQIELTDRWLAQWARKVFPYAQQRETEGPVLLIDLDGLGGAALVATPPKEPTASMRFGYPGKLATSVRGRRKKLAAGANPSELQLGNDTSIEVSAALLEHLDVRWYQTERAGQAQSTWLELGAGGVMAAYFRIGGRTFNRQDPLGRFSFHGAQQLQTLGALTDYDRFKEEAERNWPWERWHGKYEWLRATLSRRDASRYRWSLEQLVVVRDEERLRLGYVSRVAYDAERDFEVGLSLWSGAPKTVAVRPQSIAYSEEPPIPALILSETPEERPTIVLPPRTFNPGRLLRSMDPGPERKFRLTKLLQRGVDFERVAFDDA